MPNSHAKQAQNPGHKTGSASKSKSGEPETAAIPMSGKLLIQTTQDNPQMIQVDLWGTEGFILGRSDNKSSYLPDIDLAAFNALDKGVSRRHAALVYYQDRLHILDLSSVNGTFLNGNRLTPEIPYVLNSGDQLVLGQLTLNVSRTEK